MPWWGAILLSLAAALLVVWLILVVLWLRLRRAARLTEAARLLPDLMRMLSRLARDRSLPRGVRIWLWVLVGYLASPIDLVPDFIPFAGYLDDAIVIAVALRFVVRSAGPEPLARHWPGPPESLGVVRRLAGIR